MTQPSTTSCTARPQRSCSWIHGRVMGGTSGLNYMIYMRGNPLDFDEWEQQGNPGWSYKDVFPYFLKSEDNKNPDLVDPYYHNTGGYQSVSIHAYQDKNIFPIINAFRELGLPLIDHNAGSQLGVALVQATVGNGQRVTTNDAFITPIRNKRRNLVIRTNANVARVLINRKTKKAYGVEYYTNKTLNRVLARKEVIVSAGTVNSAKVLMLSGVGPAEHLQSRGIKVIHNLPVGHNLHDHTTLDGLVFSINKSSTIVDDIQRNADLQYYQQTRRGPLATSTLLQITAMVQTKYAQDSRPEIQYLLDATNVEDFFTDPILTSQTNVNAMAYYNGITVRPILLNPLSRGIVLLNDSDPVLGTPLVYPNTFTEEIDVLRIIDGIKQSLYLLETESLSKLGVQLVGNSLPACVQYEFATDEYWECLIRGYTSSVYHPAGTCKMGPKEDHAAVVDARLRVHGIKNLRVMDASIMPQVTRGNTNAPVIMIAEMGSDFIKDTWLNQQQEQENAFSENREFRSKTKWKFLNYFWEMLKEM
ncbi:hypothetical protein ILUMI_05823 [Ignelater luminosus]|uniref:Glucose dehydrogenase [FAD, quinone]-like n=1 Tax=Ignelater luminosus TaxID=2038154 RepID=A0A8K0D9S0_IGNLU|nr:hypothetical protein ILUMI_05823 [Ignelater luminosus]